MTIVAGKMKLNRNN